MVSMISQKRLNDLNCILGLDCSKYQKDITWSDVKAAGVQFAFVKITEGATGHEDNIYNVRNRVLDAQKNGVKIGYYHFARPGDVSVPEDDANAEVQNVLTHIALLPPADLPVVLDVEDYANSDVWTDKLDHMNRYITAFIAGLQEQNINVIVYSYRSFIEENSSPDFGTYPLWLASYLNNPEVNLPTIPKGWSDWTIWQFTEQGKINGYDGDIDLNIMRKDYFNSF